MCIPHLDSNNHALNLEVKTMIKEDKYLSKMICAMHQLMVSIKRSLKNSAFLQTVMHLQAKIENITRWTSVCAMMTRTRRIFDVISELVNSEGNSIVQNRAVTSANFKRRSQKNTNLMFEINQACLYLKEKLYNLASSQAVLNYIIENAREEGYSGFSTLCQ